MKIGLGNRKVNVRHMIYNVIQGVKVAKFNFGDLYYVY